MRRLLVLIWKELLELRQDPRMLPIVFVAPVLQLTVLGYAISTDVTNVPVVVVDSDRSAQSRELIEEFEASAYFRIEDVVSSVNEAARFLETGNAWMVLSVPAGYGRDVQSGRPTTVQVIADGTDSNSTSIALGYTSSLVANYAQELAAARLPAGVRAPGGLRADVRIWFNPQLESKDFLIPGVLALLLIVMTVVLASMGIVREKELGTLEQLNVTPLRRWELIVGKLLPYGLIGIIDIFLVVGVATLWFEVPLRGSFGLLFLMSLLFLVNTLGLGLFVSTVSNNQQQAMMSAVFFFVVPLMYLSGFIFPIANMPAVIQPVAYFIPLTHYLVILRGIFLKGVGISTLWPQALILAAWGTGILALATWRSRKTAG
ncbi:MAG TPA: ABC transporter permease [Vicinamibacterales bacterium]|nr:ABC transporter permease [Vicinamibacterales bacterium]